MRSKRYALKIENGKVSKTFIEPDGTGADGMCYPTWDYEGAVVRGADFVAVSMAEKVLG